MPKIVQDDFTKRLLIIHLAIIKRGEIRFKKNFTDALGITTSFYNQIESGDRNFPPEKWEGAKSGLRKEFGVNSDYLSGLSDVQFLRDAQPLQRGVKEEAVKTNFANKAEKKAVLDELEASKARVRELEAELARAAEPGVKYKSDNNPDKKKK